MFPNIRQTRGTAGRAASGNNAPSQRDARGRRRVRGAAQQSFISGSCKAAKGAGHGKPAARGARKGTCSALSRAATLKAMGAGREARQNECNASSLAGDKPRSGRRPQDHTRCTERVRAWLGVVHCGACVLRGLRAPRVPLPGPWERCCQAEGNPHPSWPLAGRPAGPVPPNVCVYLRLPGWFANISIHCARPACQCRGPRWMRTSARS